MNFDLPQTLDLLQRTPRILDALLRGTDASWHATNEGPGTWSAYDVVGHLVHGEETDWLTRAGIIVEFGVERPFDPFDRQAQFTRFAGWSLEQLLDRFAELRAKNLETVRNWDIPDAQLMLTGTHPAFGQVTLRQLLATWVFHDLNHVSQIARVLAGRYREDVGPWRAYLSILNTLGARPATSST